MTETKTEAAEHDEASDADTEAWQAMHDELLDIEPMFPQVVHRGLEDIFKSHASLQFKGVVHNHAVHTTYEQYKYVTAMAARTSNEQQKQYLEKIAGTLQSTLQKNPNFAQWQKTKEAPITKDKEFVFNGIKMVIGLGIALKSVIDFANKNYITAGIEAGIAAYLFGIHKYFDPAHVHIEQTKYIIETKFQRTLNELHIRGQDWADAATIIMQNRLYSSLAIEKNIDIFPDSVQKQVQKMNGHQLVYLDHFAKSLQDSKHGAAKQTIIDYITNK